MSATKADGRPLDRGREVNGQMVRTNGGIANQTEDHRPGIQRARRTARGAKLIRCGRNYSGWSTH